MLTKMLEKLSVPHEKNIVFISPEPKDWSSLMTRNKLVMEEIVGRRESRGELIKIAREYSHKITGMTSSYGSTDNFIVTGHQPVWHHCGIWIKNLATCRLARAVGGRSLHLILDHDVCDTSMILPKQDWRDNWYWDKTELETEQKQVPLEYRNLPHKSQFSSFINTVTKARLGQFCNRIWSQTTFPDARRMSYCNNIADIITYFQSALELALGSEIMYLPVSRLSESDAFLAFTTSIVKNSDRFASTYNDATNKLIKIKSTQHSSIRLKKLDQIADLIQLPFWLNTPDRERTTLCVITCAKDTIKICNSKSTLGKLDSASLEGKAEQFRTILHSTGYTLRPKAVPLTLFVRLNLADWFVHGIGGSLYEHVTDYLIENYFGIKPLRFGTVTCTMKLPIGNNFVSSGNDISELKHRLHDVEHNPEKYIDESLFQQEEVVSLLRVKSEIIALVGNRSVSTTDRKSAWHSLIKINQTLSKYTKEIAESIENKISDCERSEVSRKVCNYRKYFFGLFPEDKLRKWVYSLTSLGHS